MADEHNDSSHPAGTLIDGVLHSVARPESHPAASFHEILPGDIGKVEVSGISRTEFQSPTDDAKFSAAPTVEKNLAPVAINPGTRSRRNDPLN